MGGRPNGCNDDGAGQFGECCSGNCDSFAMGDNAENYEWPDMPVTEWKSGSYQESVQQSHFGSRFVFRHF